MNNMMRTIMIAFILGLFPGAQYAWTDELKIPKTHRFEITNAPQCTECHKDNASAALKPVDSFNHSAGFIERHRFYASQSDHVCSSCHKQSFCMDCHAGKDELKATTKNPDKPDRWMPHSGDYIIQHRIEGRINPASCYRCHGRQNNSTCRRCHR